MTAAEGAAEDLHALAGRVSAALARQDLETLRGLLAPDARWGAPQGPNRSDCRNRDEIIAWWSAAHEAGATATVTEVVCGRGALLVGLAVTGRSAAPEPEPRWQVWTVRDDLVVDVRGFADRAAAAARAGVEPAAT